MACATNPVRMVEFLGEEFGLIHRNDVFEEKH